ncbi:AAA family ATPase [Poseidonocella sp. HB161398]|uniref:AAA family ATPase n=1 Tax=Poseidonocella sp. HB161398 TaxID=2320855 RepID=UPI001107A7D1|nr:AAA family ATPase [Poseidonocella sp. HB161398]
MSTDGVVPEQPEAFAAWLASERAFAGIGPKRAQALADTFGAGLQDAILRGDARIVGMLGEEVALRAAEVLDERLAEAAFFRWLEEIGARLPAWQASRIARAWGPQGLAEVRGNPWLLLPVAGWDAAGQIARLSGLGETDPRREIAAVEWELGKLRQGMDAALAVDRGTLLEKVARRLGHRPSPGLADRAIAARAAVALGLDLQPPGFGYMEAEIALRTAEIAALPPAAGVTEAGLLGLLIDTDSRNGPFPLTPAQRDAVRLAHRHRLLLVSGHAGSGKTTALRALCATLEAVGRKPLILTLAGRAARRAREVTGRPAITVARFAWEQAGRQLDGRQAIIIDEASMVGVTEMWRLLRRLGEASLILVGDPAQLPPVTPGPVFHVLAEDAALPHARLSEVLRQTAATGIPAIAGEVRTGHMPELPRPVAAEPGAFFEPCAPADLTASLQLLGRMFRRAGTERDDMQIIAPTNADVARINAWFHALHPQVKAAARPEDMPVAPGEPVIWIANAPERGLTNGALGRIVSIAGPRIVAELDGIRHDLSEADMVHVQLAYAITVHKAQGSQWQRVIVPVRDSKPLDRALVYTAMTRATEQVVLIGDAGALRRAVSAPPRSDRGRTGLARWLQLARGMLSGELTPEEGNSPGT